MSDQTAAPIIPHSIEAERGLVGSILINPSALISIDVKPEDLYLHRHRYIWETFQRLARGNAVIDLLTVPEDLQRRSLLDEIGGLAYLSGLMQDTPSSLHVDDYARIVKDYAQRRDWIALANSMAKAAYDTNSKVEENAASIMDRLIKSVRFSGSAAPIGTFTSKLFEEICERMNNPSSVWGLKTGFADFDSATGGLQPGEILYMSGRPGTGKSIIAMQMGLQMGAYGIPGAIYSLEMPATQFIRRWLSQLAEVPARAIKTGEIVQIQFDRLLNVISRLEDYPIYVSDSADWTTLALRADLSRLKAMYGIKWFVLDYAYLLKDLPKVSENERTGFVSSQLKSICRALDLAGVVIHSLRKPQGELRLDDLRGSNQQSYDTDLALFIYVDEDDDHRDPAADVKIHCRFMKGRELENFQYQFDLIKPAKYPAVRNTVRVDLNRDVPDYTR